MQHVPDGRSENLDTHPNQPQSGKSVMFARTSVTNPPTAVCSLADQLAACTAYHCQKHAKALHLPLTVRGRGEKLPDELVKAVKEHFPHVLVVQDLSRLTRSVKALTRLSILLQGKATALATAE